SNILEYVWRAVLAFLIIAALVFVFRRLMFRLRTEEKASGSAILSRSRVDAGALSGGAGGRMFRPRDPRLAVRFYYARFLREAAKRGVGVDPDLTGSEIGRRSKAVFPEGLPEMYDIYAPARYSGRDITEADVRGMRSAWKNVKQNGEE
ncbi:MAG: DUF4129 domain-containing protein, partial [Eubacterium sp.]|nr:DUF4129 domain-containing protein [Eubacterium sp.]